MESPVSDASADEERGLRNKERRKSGGLLASRSLQSRRRLSQSTNPNGTKPNRGDSSGDDDDVNDNKPASEEPSAPPLSGGGNAAGARQVIGDIFSPLTKLRKNIGLETRAEKKEREADDDTPAGAGRSSNLAATSVSALTQDVMDRSSKLRQQMRTMMDRSKGAAGSTQAGGEERKPQSEEESEGDTAPSKTKAYRSTTTGFRRTKQTKERNKENAGEILRDTGVDSDNVDKLNSRLKRRGLNVGSSREEKGDNSDSDGSEGGRRGGQQPFRDHIDADHRYMRRASPSQLKTRRQLLDRVVAEHAPEMHIIGEVSYGTGFGSGVSCRWILEMGKYWSHLAGDQYGQTHTVYTLPEDGDAAMATWNHPLDIHLTTTSIQGWPRILVQVSNLDEFGRTSIIGYGFQHVPLIPGPNHMEISCWRPTGAMQDELAAYFLGVTPQLVDNDVVFTKAWDKRCRLVTLPSGRVTMHINVILRHFTEHGVDVA